MSRARGTTLTFFFLRYVLISPYVQAYLVVYLSFKVICFLYSSVYCFHIWQGWTEGPLGVSRARETTLISSLCTDLPLCPRFTFWLTFFYSKLYVTFILHLIAIIFGKEDQQACCVHQRQLSLCLLCTYRPWSDHNSHTVWDNLIIFCRIH